MVQYLTGRPPPPRYPCGTVTVLLANGEQQTVYRDGTRRRQLTDGSEEVFMPSGE